MILIAPDKYKGTLSAGEAAAAIAEGLKDKFCVRLPMADGGEGTAAIIGSGWGWQKRSGYYVHPDSRTAVIDSSSVIGISPERKKDILRASSAPLGVKVREILKGGCDRVMIAVGGTGVCDGGQGFLEGLGVQQLSTYRDSLIGLCDVQVPLVPQGATADWSAEELLGEPSALTFAPQKGATPMDIPVLFSRLERVQKEYGHGKTSPFDGAGGGLGFALATAIGAKCYPGAEYVLQQYNIKWAQVDMVITGEGCIDNQTATGKAVMTIARAAAKHGVPCVAIGGCVADDFDASAVSFAVIDSSQFYAHLPLDKKTAAMRLSAAAASIF